MTRAAQKEAEGGARNTAASLEAQWGHLESVAASASGTLKQEAEKAARDVETAWEDAQTVVEDVSDEVAETTEDVVEAATGVLDWIGGLF